MKKVNLDKSEVEKCLSRDFKVVNNGDTVILKKDNKDYAEIFKYINSDSKEFVIFNRGRKIEGETLREVLERL